MTYGVAYLVEREVYYSLPFLLLFQFGFAYVGLAERVRGPPRPVVRRLGSPAPAAAARPTAGSRHRAGAVSARASESRIRFSKTATPRSSRPTSAKPSRSQNARAPGFSSPTEQPSGVEARHARARARARRRSPCRSRAPGTPRGRAGAPMCAVPGLRVVQVEVEDADRRTAGARHEDEDARRLSSASASARSRVGGVAPGLPSVRASIRARRRSTPGSATSPAPAAAREPGTVERVERAAGLVLRVVIGGPSRWKRLHSVAWSRGSRRRPLGRLDSPGCAAGPGGGGRAVSARG